MSTTSTSTTTTTSTTSTSSSTTITLPARIKVVSAIDKGYPKKSKINY